MPRTPAGGIARAGIGLPAGLTDFEAGIPGKQFRYLNTWNTVGVDWPADTWCRRSNDHPDGLASMSDLFDAATYMEEMGYQQVNLGSSAAEFGQPVALTVEGLKNVGGDGVSFWTTHGGNLDLDGNIIQGLMTATTAYKDTVEDTYADEFTEGTLIAIHKMPGGL